MTASSRAHAAAMATKGHDMIVVVVVVAVVIVVVVVVLVMK